MSLDTLLSRAIPHPFPRPLLHALCLLWAAQAAGWQWLAAGSLVSYLACPDAAWEDSPERSAEAGATGAGPKDQAINH